MKQLFENEELIGKTIKRAINPDSNYSKMFLFFEDESFCIFESIGDDVEIDDQNYNQNPNRWNHRQLFELGFIDQAKFIEIQSSVEKEREEDRKKQDLETLRKLQEKYGSVSF